MKAPDKIYARITAGELDARLTQDTMFGEPYLEYLRADLAKKELKETVEVAEDHAKFAGRVQMQEEYRNNFFAGLTWRDIQDIWFITDKVLRSIPEDYTKREEWMFSTQGRFTKALEEVKKYREENGNKD